MKTPYPPGAYPVHGFGFFNAVAFQIMMGAPVILYAQSLGASSTVLGIIAAFTPLMTIFQIPAARFLDRISYRRFVLSGWSLRTAFIFIVAAVPLLFFLGPGDKLAVMMAALFCFNLLRGISSAAWMPWITELIPPEIRGTFLSRDQIFLHLGSLVSLLASALIMSGDVANWEYALVFLLAAMGGFLSLLFIRKIPDIPRGESTAISAQPVPWKAMLLYPPFRDLLIFNVAFTIVLGSLAVFSVEFLREVPRFGVDMILLLSGVSFLGALFTLPFTGRIVDHFGGKPLLLSALSLLALVIFGWFFVAAGVLPATTSVIATLNFFAGAAGSNFHIANARIAMGTMPKMGRNHFFALFTVCCGLGLGTSPVVWGMLIDAIGTFELATGALHWRRHSIYFLGVGICCLVAILLALRLREPEMPLHHEREPVYTGLKRWERIWKR